MIDVRERVGAGGLRMRAVRQAKRAVRPSLVALTGLAIGFACFLYLVLHIDRTALVGSHEVAFAVDNANAVHPKVNEVRFKGIPAGKITKVEMRGIQPVVVVRLESRYGKVYRDARAVLRPNTPLQDMYLNIVDRGHRATGVASVSNPVPVSRTDTAVRISEVLDVFGGDERARLAHLLDDFGNGLDDRGAALRTAFADLVPFIRVAGNVTEQLGRNAPLTRRLVHNVGLLTSELGRREGQLRRLVDQGGATLTTLQAGSGDLDATLRELPGTLTAADSSFTAVRGVLGDLNGALAGLGPVADDLPASLAAVRRLADAARPAVVALGRPVSRLVPFTQALNPVSRSLSTSVTRLLPQVPALDKTIGVVDKCLPELNGFMQWDASMAKFGDAAGAVPRGNAVFGAASVGTASPYEAYIKVCAPGRAIGGRPATTKDEG